MIHEQQVVHLQIFCAAIASHHGWHHTSLQQMSRCIDTQRRGGIALTKEMLIMHMRYSRKLLADIVIDGIMGSTAVRTHQQGIDID